VEKPDLSVCARCTDAKAELECARESASRHESALVDKEREFCQKLERVRAENSCKIHQLSSEM